MLLQASQLDAQAAENAVEAAKLESELLQCETEAMKSELQQVSPIQLTSTATAITAPVLTLACLAEPGAARVREGSGDRSCGRGNRAVAECRRGIIRHNGAAAGSRRGAHDVCAVRGRLSVRCRRQPHQPAPQGRRRCGVWPCAGAAARGGCAVRRAGVDGGGHRGRRVARGAEHAHGRVCRARARVCDEAGCTEAVRRGELARVTVCNAAASAGARDRVVRMHACMQSARPLHTRGCERRG